MAPRYLLAYSVLLNKSRRFIALSIRLCYSLGQSLTILVPFLVVVDTSAKTSYPDSYQSNNGHENKNADDDSFHRTGSSVAKLLVLCR